MLMDPAPLRGPWVQGGLPWPSGGTGQGEECWIILRSASEALDCISGCVKDSASPSSTWIPGSLSALLDPQTQGFGDRIYEQAASLVAVLPSLCPVDDLQSILT